MREEVGGGLDQVAARAEVEHGARLIEARWPSLAEQERCLAGLNGTGVEPHLGAWGVMRGE
jgi:hypothetical protein